MRLKATKYSLISKKTIFYLLISIVPNFGFSLFAQTLAHNSDETKIPGKVHLISTLNQQWEKGGRFDGFSPNQEIVGKRTKNSKHFLRADGKITVQIGAPMHYKDNSGAWQDISNDIKKIENNNYSYGNLTNNIKSYFPKDAVTQGVSMILESGTNFQWWQNPSFEIMQNGQVAKSWQSNHSLGTKQGSKVVYSNIFPNISEEFEVVDNGLESNTIIHQFPTELNSFSASSLVSFSQFIPLKNGWKVFANGQSQARNFNAKDFSIQMNGEQDLIYFGNIVVFDNALSKEEAMLINIPTDKLSTSQKEKINKHLLSLKYNVVFVDGGIKISTMLPISWLKDNSRSFPVTIDPVVTITPSGSAGSFYGPMTHWYGYQRNADLYLQSEIQGYGDIVSIEYNATGTETSGNKPTKVYMRSIPGTTLSGTAAWNSTSYTGAGAQLCLDANTDQGSTSGWKMLTLTTPYSYTSDNLLVMVYDAYGGSGSAKYYNQSGSTSTTRRAFKRQDNTDPGDGSATDTEDKLQEIRITYNYGTPCTGQPTAGTVPATLAVCPNVDFTLTATGSTQGGSMVNQWQSKVGAGAWTNITGALYSNYTVTGGISVATSYRYYTTCTPSGLSDTSGVMTTTINPASQCYCTPSTNSSTYYINNFSTTGGTVNISKLLSGYSLNGYGNFFATDSASKVAGGTINFNGDFGSGSYGVKIWVDWNQNGNFNDPGEQVYVTSSYVTSFTGTITVPLTATAGVTRMRIGANYNNSTGPATPCEVFTSGEYEDYKFVVISLQPCTAVTLPTTMTIDADHDTVCVAQDVTLTLTSTMPPVTGLTYQYQSAPSATGPWTDIGTPQATSTLIAPNVSTAIFYRLQVLCSGTVVAGTASNVLPITITNPAVLTTTPGTRCGPGTVALGATASTNSTVKWYTAASGGLSIGTGNTFTTPYITQTTNFYAGAGVGGGSGLITVGAGASTSVSGSPDYSGVSFFAYHYGNYKNQILFTASELNALGMTGGVITSIAFDIASIGASPATFNDFTISIKSSTATAMTSTFETGLTTVYNGNVVPTLGINTFTFSTPFLWDGVSNLVIQTCYHNDNSGVVANSAEMKYDVTSFVSHTVYRADGVQSGICSVASGNTGNDGPTSSKRPKVIFDFNGGCESPRTAVAATVTPGPTFAISYDSVVCNNTPRPISVSSALGSYSSYVWTPTTDLYTNATGTTPYTGGSESTVYFKSTTAGLHTYAVAATNGTLQTNCAAADTARIWVQPGGTTISAMPDTICVSGTSDLKLVPDSNYFAGTIQWQQSATGATYTNITGANTPAYTTPNLTSEHYYKAVISAQAGVCLSPVKHILISNPQVVSVQDSFHCGPGVVNLAAVGAINTGLKWYENASGGLSVGSGSNYATPYLLQTDTFYVTSGVGGGSIPPTFIGNGTGTLSGTPSPFYTTYWGNKNQYLIKASELIAAGFSAGVITSIGFDVVDNSGLPMTGYTIAMKGTTLTTLSTTWETGLTTVYSAATSYTPVANSVNTFSFSTPFAWNGSDNIIIETCFNNSSWSGGHSVKYTSGLSFNASHYFYQDGSTVCSAPGVGYTSSDRPNIQFTMNSGCESPRHPVIAYIRPVPDVNLGNDFNVCVDAGANFTLDAGTFPNSPTYLWDNNSTSQTRGVNTSGSYRVAVTNSYGCTGRDTVNVTLRNNPVVNLGGDTTVCEGIILTLDAGTDGISYFWSTGENSDSIQVDHSGTYTVIVTNSVGCTKTDTIKITMSGHIPTIDGINVNNIGPMSFKFNAINPQNSVSYDWDFGDGSAHSPMINPSHTYPNANNYLVKLKILGTCGQVLDSTYVHIVGIGKVNADKSELYIFPNPTTGKAKIVNKGNLRMESIEVFNVLGQKVYSEKSDSPKEHEISLQGIASGIYTVQILTDEGIVNQKLEIVK